MKKFVCALLFFCMISATVGAQDDMYFKPTKKEKKEVKVYQPKVVDYGCNRDVDEYNRYGKFRSQYSVIGSDSITNDIIDFQEGVPSDTIYYGEESNFSDDDYAYSRRLSRFDDYYWYDPWYWSSWYGPWGYTSPYWYARYGWGWYDPWYDPWFYGGWYHSYYWGWNGGWHHPIYVNHFGGGHPRGFNGFTGSGNHSAGANQNGRRFAQRGGVGRGSYTTRGSVNGSHRINGYNSDSFNQSSTSRSSFGGGSFGGNRGSFGGGGSFGGNRGGSFGGGGGVRAGGRR